MGQDGSAKKKLKRDHSKPDHAKVKSPDKPKKSPSKKAKPDKSPAKEKPAKASSPTSTPKSTPKPKPASKPKPESKSEDTGDLLFKPGQRHPEPSLDDPTRAFYESLYEQNPNSHMAQKYCVEYGLLPEDLAGRLSEALKRKGK